jgi:predicted component of type VI protein secretion system
MASSSKLPSRFPVGTKFVIEGRTGGEGQVQVYSRHLEFPDGTLVRLPARPVPAQLKPKAPISRRQRARRRRDRKN